MLSYPAHNTILTAPTQQHHQHHLRRRLPRHRRHDRLRLKQSRHRRLHPRSSQKPPPQRHPRQRRCVYLPHPPALLTPLPDHKPPEFPSLSSNESILTTPSPGPVHTPIQPASRPPEQMEDFGKKSQLGRAGQPSEIAPTYVFLASGESELYYGQVRVARMGGLG